MSKGIEMTTTTDHTEIRNSADDDAQSDRRQRVDAYAFAIYDDTRGVTGRTRKVMAIADAENAALTAEVGRLTLMLELVMSIDEATIERVRALAARWEQEVPCPCSTCTTNRNHAALIRAALKGPLS